MMVINQETAAREAIKNAAVSIAAAANTAPKGKGADNVVVVIVNGEDKDALAEKMREIAAETGGDKIFLRDAINVDSSEAVVVIGAKYAPVGLPNCGICGFSDCAAAIEAGAWCNFNIMDLGIAVGSAVSIAADLRIDNRVIYTGGKAAVKLGIFPESSKVNTALAIPLSVSSKSIFFDRGDPIKHD